MTFSTEVIAGHVLDRFEARQYVSPEGGKLLYRLLSPQGYDKSKTYPLILFLHGAGERGDDNRKQLVHGMKDFATDAAQDRHPCFVVAPQCPDGEKWVDVSWSEEKHTMPVNPSNAMRMTLELLDVLSREFSVDRRCVYVTGLSMGGFGAWDALSRKPDLFAAAVPICGGGDPAQVKRFAHIPVWAFHGDKDDAVKPVCSRDLVAALKAAGGSPRYTEYANTGHDSWTATYANPDVHEWLFAQRKPVDQTKDGRSSR